MRQVEGLDQVWGIGKVFGWFPAGCIWGVIKPFTFNQVEETSALSMAIHPAVQDPIDFPFF